MPVIIRDIGAYAKHTENKKRRSYEDSREDTNMNV